MPSRLRALFSTSGMCKCEACSISVVLKEAGYVNVALPLLRLLLCWVSRHASIIKANVCKSTYPLRVPPKVLGARSPSLHSNVHVCARPQHCTGRLLWGAGHPASVVAKWQLHGIQSKSSQCPAQHASFGQVDVQLPPGTHDRWSLLFLSFGH